NTSRPLNRWWDNPPAASKRAVARLRQSFERAGTDAANEREPIAVRLAAIRLLGQAPASIAIPALKQLLVPQSPDALQSTAVQALSLHDASNVPRILVDAWAVSGPAVRREIQEALFARANRIPELLNAIEQKQIRPQQLD